MLQLELLLLICRVVNGVLGRSILVHGHELVLVGQRAHEGGWNHRHVVALVHLPNPVGLRRQNRDH